MKRLQRVQFEIMQLLWDEAERRKTLVIDDVYMFLKEHVEKTNSIHNTLKRLKNKGFIKMIGGFYSRGQKCEIIITKDEYKEKEAIDVNKILKKENDYSSILTVQENKCKSRLDKEESVLHNVNVDNKTSCSIPKILSYGRGYAYSIQYHIVWTTDQNRPILEGPIVEEIKGYLLEILRALEMVPSVIKIMPDYIHLFVDCKPQLLIPNALKSLKGQTARYLLSNHPELKQELYNGHLWDQSYLIITPSDNTDQQIKEYISK